MCNGGRVMKKYWKFIAMSVVIVLTISTYYIQSAIANKNFDYKIEKVSGNEAEIENLILEVSIPTNNYIWRNYSLTKDGLISQYGDSMVINAFSPLPLSLNNQLGEYRSFVRGKNPYSNFLINDNRMIYIGTENYNTKEWNKRAVNIEVEILDKETEKRQKFELTSQLSTIYQMASIKSIYHVDGEIKLIVELHTTNAGSSLYAFTIDEEQQAITKETLLAINDKDSYFRNYNGVSDNNRYFIYNVEKFESNTPAPSVPTDLYVYDFQSENTEKLELPNEVRSKMDYTYTFLNNEKLYVFNRLETGIKGYQYNIESKQWHESVSFPLPISNEIQTIREIENKLYSVHADDVIVGDDIQYVLLIHDLETTDVLFEGKITQSGSQKNLQTHFYDIYQVEDK